MDLKIVWLTLKEVLQKTGAEASEENIKFEIEELKKKKMMMNNVSINKSELEEKNVDHYSYNI